KPKRQWYEVARAWWGKEGVSSKLAALTKEHQQEAKLAAESNQGERLHIQVAQRIKAKTSDKWDRVLEEQKSTQQRLADQQRRMVQRIGAPPPVSFFVGRVALREQIMKALSDKKRQIHLLCGPGGMGKSQLAIQLFNALEQQGGYDHVFWLSAEAADKLQQEFFYLADQLGISVDKRDPNAIRTIKAHLEQKHCLYVFDDAPSSEVIRPYMPTQRGHMLLTSRNSKPGDWDVAVKSWPLSQFGKGNVVALGSKFGFGAAEIDERVQKYLLEELSGYPFILAQFFSLCQSEGQRPAAYMQELAESRLSAAQAAGLSELLEESPEQRVVYKKSLVQILSRNLTKLSEAKEGKLAFSLLRRFAYLSPRGIPLQLIEHLKKGNRKVRKALGALEKYSLAQWDRAAGLVYVHAVTQQVVRHLHPVDEVGQLAQRLIDYAGDWDESHKHQAEWSTLLLHGASLINSLEGKEGLPAKYKLSAALGQACHVACLYDESIKWREETVSLARAIHGDVPHADLGSSLYNLAYVYKEKGAYPKARALYEQALKIDKKVYGEEHPNVATTLHELGSLHSSEGAYPKARALYEQALKIYKKVYGEEHPSVATTLHELGSLHSKEGAYPEARALYEQALKIDKKFYGEEHPFVAWGYYGLGEVSRETKDYQQAAQYHQQALTIRLKTYSQHKAHREIALSYSGMGEMYWEQGNYQEAITHQQKALDMFLKVYGATPHKATARSYRGLGDVYIDQKRYKKAGEALNKALAMLCKVFPSQSHPDIATAYHALGRLCRAQNNYQEAAAYFEKALVMRAKYLPSTHPYLAASSKNLEEMKEALAKRSQDSKQ
ncbi:MAG: tetratricopeptide repeat protein, partial [Bacteroidota bacterium]